MSNHLPPLLADRAPAARVALAAGVPAAFGIVTGAMLGLSELVYTVLSLLGIAGGFVAGLEHSRPRDGLLRGIVGGSIFGASILLAHGALFDAAPKAHLPEPELLLVALTTAFGAGLGALGGRRRARHERSHAQAEAATPARRSNAPWHQIVDLNRASLDELMLLPVVGRRAAERIDAHRRQHGPFTSVEELVHVEGFTSSRASRIAARATIG